LEKELWETYIEGLKEDVIAYHFKKVVDLDRVASGIDDFGVLTRFEFQCLNKQRLLSYIYVIVYIGVLSGILANQLWKSSSITIIMFVAGVICLVFIWNLSHK
jgi:hypothetical protein